MKKSNIVNFYINQDIVCTYCFIWYWSESYIEYFAQSQRNESFVSLVSVSFHNFKMRFYYGFCSILLLLKRDFKHYKCLPWYCLTSEKKLRKMFRRSAVLILLTYTKMRFTANGILRFRHATTGTLSDKLTKTDTHEF